MPNYKYLIVGGGMTADAAVAGIREADPNGSIGLISAEPDPPYNRPPLSKALWKGEPLESIWRGTEALGGGAARSRDAGPRAGAGRPGLPRRPLPLPGGVLPGEGGGRAAGGRGDRGRAAWRRAGAAHHQGGRGGG